MRVVFMGNPGFAIPTLEKIIQSHHDITCIVSNDPKPMGRRKILKYTAVGEYANQHQISLIEIGSFQKNTIISQLVSFNADVFVVVAYRVLPRSILTIPKIGSINLHASLLPKYRGAAPIQWALMNGDKTTGVTTFIIDPKVDTGDILLQKKIEIHDSDDYGTLSERSSHLGADLILDTLCQLEKGKTKPIQQEKDLATQAPKISKEMTIINWNWPALKIHNWIRGLSPTPGMSTSWNGKRMRVFKTSVIESSENDLPGIVQKRSKNELIISAGKGCLSLTEIQQDSKKRLPISEFLRGCTVSVGDTFI